MKLFALISHAQIAAFGLLLAALVHLAFTPVHTRSALYWPGNTVDTFEVVGRLHPVLLLAAGCATTVLFSYHYRSVGRWK